MNRKKASSIRYTSHEEVHDALIEFMIFLCFLILTTIVALTTRDSHMFYFQETIDKMFVNSDIVIGSGLSINFAKSITVNDLWKFLQYGFLYIFHGVQSNKSAIIVNATTTTSAPYVAKTMGTINTQMIKNNPNTLNIADTAIPANNAKLKAEDGDSIVDDITDNYDMIGDLGNIIDSYDSHQRLQNELPNDFLMNQNNNKLVGLHPTQMNLVGRVFLKENVLLGPPRVRQIRVKKDSCFVNDAFIRYFNTCYAEYSQSNEEQEEFFKGTEFRTTDQLKSTNIWAEIATYVGGGYVQMLTYDSAQNNQILASLKNSDWIDRGSRLIVLEFSMYNDNVDIFASVKFLAEMPPTGGILPSLQMQSIKESSFFTMPIILTKIVIVLFYVMVLYYTFKEIFEVRKVGIQRYFASILNLLDSLILVFAYLALVYNIWHQVHVDTILRNSERKDEYQSLDNLCYYNTIYVDIMALLNFFVWIKIFKFISFNKTLVQFTTTLKRCSKDLAGFSLMFLIVFLAYAQLGLLLFGTKHPDFRSFVTSVLTMIRMILGDFNYELIEKANRVLGPIYFLTYILLVFFILLNMFLAIIMETYSSVKSEITEGKSQLGDYLFRKVKILYLYIRYCGKPPVYMLTTIQAYGGSIAKMEEARHASKKVQDPSEERYFNIPQPQVMSTEIARLTNRVNLLEEMLEQLVSNMDSILKKVEREQKKRKDE